MYRIGQEIHVKIEKIVFGGEGLGYIDGFIIFVPMSAIGDELIVEVISVKKTYARALIKKILIPSPDRIESEKITFEEYNGCDFGMLKYEKQLEYKDKMLKEMMQNISKIDISDIYENIQGSTQINNYRNKIAEPFFKQDNIIKTGFYERKSHKVFSSSEDILKSKIAVKFTKIVCDLLNKSDFTVYNDITKSGFLKHLIIRNNSKDDVMIGIVVTKKTRLSKLKKILQDVYDMYEEVKSVYISVKNIENNVILGDENILIAGNEYISENIFDLNFKIHLDSFFQVNITQVKKLYSKAIEYLGETTNCVIDAFSGTGTIGMLLSKNSKKVICIESVENASVAANITARENNISNIEFVTGKVEHKIDKVMLKENVTHIVFDPPRKGVDIKALKSVIKNKINKIVYISCEPSTFARDLNYLTENGYKLTKMSAVDMFSNTHHIETVALIERK
ncbi:23S rRNA (uracil(1939)-C(5))-methyltransferase RlmD [Caviibacter abscessus]|uniref:23S rRNA (uracil(1939)-C(5))-methyltransferase RlmD n=1 Tax=Caviibacter abscessus TaxID=1766719 RepID=UPI000836C044|nr:23S rRNA (uracil(1939)-C(5))-methyltransferase RlmD [Caviibacter abscessus]